MKRCVITLAAALACAVAAAMPTEEQMAQVQPVIEELARDAFNAMKAGRMTRGQFAETMLGYLSDADTEAAKVVLIHQAFRQLMLSGATGKAVEAYALLGANVADVPGGTFGAWCAPFVANLVKGDKANDLAILLEHAFDAGDAESATALYKQLQPNLRKLSAAKSGGARLSAVAGRFAGLERRKAEARNLRAALRDSPDDVALREKYGLCLVAMGDWKAALKEFAQTGGRLAEVAVWENTQPEAGSSPLTAAEVAEFWWGKAEALAKDAEVAAALRGHAAGWYRVAVEGGELTGLKKTLAEKRIAEVEKTGEVAVVGGADVDAGKPITIPMGKGVEMVLMPIPAGTFTMGYENVSEWLRHALLPHPVTITRPFWMGKFPVTREQYACLGKLPDIPPTSAFSKWCNALGGKIPVGGVLPVTIDEFLDQMNRKFKRFLPQGYVFRLPTMAEWEYACRANGNPEKDWYAMRDTSKLSLDDFKKNFLSVEDRQQMANEKSLPFLLKGIGQLPLPVGTKPPNPWGLCDMRGNLFLEYAMDRFPSGTPIKMSNTHGQMTPETLDWTGMEIDPLFWNEDKDAIGCATETMLWFGEKDLQNVSVIRRIFYTRKRYASNSWGFRVVIGPDLVKERKQKPLGK